MRKWRVYYSDGSTFNGPGKPPFWGTQVILERNEEGNLITRCGGDFYVFENDVWVEVDYNGLLDFLSRTGLVMIGTTIPNKKFDDILKKALVDKETFDG